VTASGTLSNMLRSLCVSLWRRTLALLADAGYGFLGTYTPLTDPSGRLRCLIGSLLISSDLPPLLIVSLDRKTTLNTDSASLEIPDTLVALTDETILTQPVRAEVDARDLVCPLPLLKAKQALRELNAGDLLRVVATDAGSLKDFVSFAQITQQIIEGFFVRDQVYYYLIRKHK
jgi:tRNA 2-thiouridine synthesizing protein A